MKRICYQLFNLLFLLVISTEAIAQSFMNPIGPLPDPSIVYRNGYYYYTGTTGGVNVSLKRATTLEGLKSAAQLTVFSSANGGPCCNYWASELMWIDNKWYIYYTAGTSSDINTQRAYVIENSSADPFTGTWVNRGKVYSPGADWYAIDGTVLSLNGINYFLWSGHLNATDPFDGTQRIYIQRMSNPWTLTGSRTLISSPDYAWEGNINEGPEVIRRNGKVFIVYSASHCSSPNYALGMLSMNETADPLNAASWFKHPNPVFQRNDAVMAYGPGHHCFFTSPDGTEDWFAYHATSYSGGVCDDSRTTRAQKLTWNSDGTPNFGIPQATGIRFKAPSGEVNLPAGTPIPNGVYRFVVKNSGKVLDVAGCEPHWGTNVHQWTWLNNKCQKWNIQATGDGFYTITSLAGGLALEVQNCSVDNGANVRMWTPNGADCQKWSIINVNGTYYRIVSKRSGKALDIQFGATTDGANLQQYDWLNADNQQFLLDPTDGGSPDITNLSGSVSAQYNNSPAGEEISKLIDNNVNTKFLTFNSSSWVQFQANSSHVVSSYSITSANDAPERDPLNWTFQGSVNGLTWTTIDSRSGEDFPSRFQKRFFNFNNSGSYNYYRFNFTNNSGSLLQVAEVEIFGTPGITNAIFSQTIQAENYSAMAGIQTEATTDAGGGLNVGWIETNDWMAYNSIAIPTSGNYTIDYRVASPNTGGQISIDINAGAVVLGTVAVPNTGGWQNWQTVSHTVNLNAGTYNFGIFAAAGGWNINWWRIRSGGTGARISSEQVEKQQQIYVFPNPASKMLTINGASAIKLANYTVYNAHGIPALRGVLIDGNLDVSSLPTGIYTIVVSDKRKALSTRFIKE